VIAIATSTGGPRALEEILPKLPADLGIPVLVVQHMPTGFTSPFARRLDNLCLLSVREASPDEEVKPDVVYLAPAGFHMTVHRVADSRARVVLSSDAKGYLHVPSADVLMLSVAEEYGSHALGIVMTGMGSDGMEGMKAIHRNGGFTIGQDEASSAVYGMPRACAMAGCLCQVLPLEEIPRQVLLAMRYRKRA
jgi:two-component system chemotaxis response regulator CheB